MNAQQNKHMRMFTNTQQALENNSDKWNGIPIMVANKNELDELLQRIIRVNKETKPISKAVTNDKKMERLALTEKTLGIAGILQAYASINSNNQLAEIADITKSSLLTCRETEVETTINPIVDEARRLLPLLVDYTLTEEMVLEVETSLDDYKVLIGQPRTIRNKAFTAITALEDLFNKTNEILKNRIDKLMIRFKMTDPEFYETYTRARVIID